MAKRRKKKRGTKKRRATKKRRKTKKRTTAKRKTAKRRTKRRTVRKKKGKKRKANAAFMAKLRPSPALAKVVGSKPLPRTQVVKKLWAYIKRKKLQDKKNKRMINADATLKVIFRGKKKINMFEMMKHLNRNLK